MLHNTAVAMKIVHAGLRRPCERDDARRLNPAQVPHPFGSLTDLDVARSPRNLDAPEYRLHPLKEDRRGRWSVRVSANWRIVFRFEDFEAVDVDLGDDH